MLLVVDFDGFGRNQHRMDCAPKSAKLALDFTHRPIAPEICPELVAGLEIQPHSQLPGVMTKNAFPVQPEPSGKRIVHLDKFAIAQPRNRHKGRAGGKGPAEALLTFAQPRLALSQKVLRVHELNRAFCDASLKRCIELTDLVLCPLALSNIHDGANELKLPSWANQGTTHTPHKLDRAIREDDPILEFKIV